MLLLYFEKWPSASELHTFPANGAEIETFIDTTWEHVSLKDGDKIYRNWGYALSPEITPEIRDESLVFHAQVHDHKVHDNEQLYHTCSCCKASILRGNRPSRQLCFNF